MKKCLLIPAFILFFFVTAFSGEKNSDNMIFVKGGKFLMGDPDGNGSVQERDEFSLSLPAQKEVTVSDFFISRHETTIGEFAAFVKATKYKSLSELLMNTMIFKNNNWIRLPGYSWKKPGYPVRDNFPVTCVALKDAAEFCNYLSKIENRKPCYSYDDNGSIALDASADGYRLPTEQEWEYAARSGSNTTRGIPYESGKAAGNIVDKTFMDATGLPGGVSNYTDGFAYASPVESLAPNTLGIFDMTGNVWEMTSSWFYQNTNTRLVIKGGGWYSPLDFGTEALYPTYRAGGPVFGLYSDVGFRVARSVKTKD